VGIFGALAVALLVLAGLAIFWRRYRGTRAGLPLFAAFTLGLAPVVTYGVLQVTVGPDHEMPVTVIFMTHLAMSMVLVLFLGGILSLRQPPSDSYRKAESALGVVLAALGILGYGAVAWSGGPQDDVNRVVVTFVPLLAAVSILGRFGMQRDGLLGTGVFLALFGSYLVHFVTRPDDPGRALPVLVANIVNMASLIGMVVFFYLVAKNPHLVRTPWSGGSLGMNLARCFSAGLLILSLAVCGYCFDSLWESGWPAQWSSEFIPLALASAIAYAGCFVGVAGVTTGYNPLQGRSSTQPDRGHITAL
jgi:uncharacterized protein with PQ loop repeat